MFGLKDNSDTKEILDYFYNQDKKLLHSFVPAIKYESVYPTIMKTKLQEHLKKKRNE